MERTRLEYAILATLAISPLAGTGLCRRLSDLPLGGRGSSSGAVYPALRRLRKAGLVETVDKPRLESVAYDRYQDRDSGAWYGPPSCMRRPRSGVRRFQLNRLTARGRHVALSWAARPIELEDMRRCPEELLLRFGALASDALDPEPSRGRASDGRSAGRELAAVSFLSDYAVVAGRACDDMRDRLRGRCRSIPRARRARAPISLEERLATELLARLWETRAAWARQSARDIERAASARESGERG